MTLSHTSKWVPFSQLGNLSQIFPIKRLKFISASVFWSLEEKKTCISYQFDSVQILVNSKVASIPTLIRPKNWPKDRSEWLYVAGISLHLYYSWKWSFGHSYVVLRQNSNDESCHHISSLIHPIYIQFYGSSFDKNS